MTINVSLVRERLSDGSSVFKVIVANGDVHVTLHATSPGDAVRLAFKLCCAINKHACDAAHLTG